MKNKKIINVGLNCVRQENGITLVALIITIIVLLILVGITITLVIGDNGLIAKAQQAGRNYSEAENKEINNLNSLENEMIASTSRGENTNLPTSLEWNLVATLTQTGESNGADVDFSKYNEIYFTAVEAEAAYDVFGHVICNSLKDTYSSFYSTTMYYSASNYLYVQLKISRMKVFWSTQHNSTSEVHTVYVYAR